MSLPAPDLDNRPFQSIVDDVKLQIAQRCPEWTDHNVSDPGVTLLELFAWMMEMTLYRLNQVPERNYIKFLEMMGITLEPPAAAQTDLRFRLSRPIGDTDGEEALERVLGERTGAATLRTPTQPATEFTTDESLKMVRPRLRWIIAAPAGSVDAAPNSAGIGDAVAASASVPARNSFRTFATIEGEIPWGAALSFPIFSATPQEGDGLCFGFEADISGNIVELEADCVRSAATGLNEDYPSQVWEYWNGVERAWRPVENPRDTTRGFNRPPGQILDDAPSGFIELCLPPRLMTRQIAGHKAFWIRCRYTASLPPITRGRRILTVGHYDRSPELRGIRARVLGGTVGATNCFIARNIALGKSDGAPGQTYFIPHAPLQPFLPGETIALSPSELDGKDWSQWKLVSDFADCGPNDRCFTCDLTTGEVRFGPAIPEPSGGVRHYGAAPPRGLAVQFTAVRYGGGIQGNIAAGMVQTLSSAIPYIASVTNPRPATGGRAGETLERAKMRAQAMFRNRNRAVTAEDFERLALEASSSINRVRCIQPRFIRSGAPGEEAPVDAGVVRLLLVPTLNESIVTPRPDDLGVEGKVIDAVEQYLDERRLLTATLYIAAPTYIWISTDLTVIADDKSDPDEITRSIRERLNRYIHPITGGPHGTGWPFGGPLTFADLFAQALTCPGVLFLREARVFTSRAVATGTGGALTPEKRYAGADALTLGQDELLCTREHRVLVRSLSSLTYGE